MVVVLVLAGASDSGDNAGDENSDNAKGGSSGAGGNALPLPH